MRIHKFLGFYKHRKHLYAPYNRDKKMIVLFRDQKEYADLYIAHDTNNIKVLFLSLRRYHSNKRKNYYYKLEFYNTVFFLLEDQEASEREFKWFLYIGATKVKMETRNKNKKKTFYRNYILSDEIE